MAGNGARTMYISTVTILPRKQHIGGAVHLAIFAPRNVEIASCFENENALTAFLNMRETSPLARAAIAIGWRRHLVLS